jgi:hypothetical protein
MTFKEILDAGYEISVTGLSENDYSEDPALYDLEAYRVTVISPDGKAYLFNFEYDAPFELALENAFEYISITNN